MNGLNKISINNKLLIVYMSITALVLVIAFAIVTWVNLVSAEKNMVAGLRVVAEIAANNGAASLVFTDVESAKSHMALLKSHKAIVYACIRTIENKEFVEYGVNIDNKYVCHNYESKDGFVIKGGYVDVFKPIMLEGRRIGSLQIKASLHELRERTIKSAKLSIMIFVGLMVPTVFLSNHIVSFITRPITKLKNIAENIAKNEDYSLRMKNNSDDEVGVLIESFNNMLDQIEKRDCSVIMEKEKAEKSADAAKKYALETEKVNKNLEGEIRERIRIEKELYELNETLEDKVVERTSELKELNEKIGDIARSAGMAEVASGVLHNVGNVLNSVNVSVSVIREKVRKTKADNLFKVVKLLENNSENVGEFINNDDKGKKIPKFLFLLSGELNDEKKALNEELDDLANNVDHIKNVISMQQSYAGSYGLKEEVVLSDLVEDSLRMNLQGMERHGIKVVRSYKEIPKLYLDKHKALQIMINLISNAKHAMFESKNKVKNLTVGISKHEGFARLEIKDTGIGISKKDMQHLFEYGFKKRRDGHGFGLHHSAIIANEFGGNISVSSDGPDKGACFVLHIPYDAKVSS